MPHNKTSPEKEKQVVKMRKAGCTNADIIRETGVSQKTIARICRDHGAALSKRESGRKSKRIMHSTGRQFSIVNT